MRLLPSLLLLVLTLSTRLSAQNSDLPTRFGTIPDQSIVQSVRNPAIDLRNYFQVNGINGQVVQFNTPGVGLFNVEMNTVAAQNTVANFLAYVNAGRFTNSFTHRSDPATGIIQGGSFLRSVDANGHVIGVTTSAPINLETSDSLANTAGTIAMARTSQPNSATSGWFINVTDNSAGLPPASAGGYAAFGRVTGTGMTVVNAIAALPVLGGTVTVTGSSTANAAVFVDSATLPSNFGPGWVLLGGTVQNVVGNLVTLDVNADRTITTNTFVPYTYFSATAVPASNNNALTQLPVFTNLASAGASLLLSNLVTQSSITVVPVFPTTPTGPSVVTFTAVSSNPSLVSATISGSSLSVAAAANQNGSAAITVNATDTNGNTVTQTPFNVTVTKKVLGILDLNGDGFSDLIFQNKAGQISRWFLDGTGNQVNFSTGSGLKPGSGYFYTGPVGDFRVVAIGDVNGDGIPDLIFQNGAGQVSKWILDGTGNPVNFSTGVGLKPGSGYLYTGPVGDFRVVAMGDVNGDGIPDLVFQNGAGQVSVWILDGTGNPVNFSTGVGLKPGSGYLYTGPVGDFRVMAIGDVNGDGIPDLVFQNGAGQVSMWILDGTGNPVNFSTGVGLKPGSGYLYTGPVGDFRVVRIGDMNGDGIPDLVFQNGAGQLAVWFLDGSGNQVNFSTGVGLKPGSGYLYSGAVGDFRAH